MWARSVTDGLDTGREADGTNTVFSFACSMACADNILVMP